MNVWVIEIHIYIYNLQYCFLYSLSTKNLVEVGFDRLRTNFPYYIKTILYVVLISDVTARLGL